MHRCCRWLPVLLLASTLLPAVADDKRPERIVFIGDSITDGHTCPLLVRQAFAEAGKPVPVCINAGVASDTAALVRKRLERDVLVHKPTLATLSIGINDVLHKVKPEDYEADVAAILDRLTTEKVPVLILTTTVLGPKHAEAEKQLATYNAILRRLAAKHHGGVAEVFKGMSDTRASGAIVLESDQVHLSFDGYRVMARAVLDGLGHKDVAVPKELKPELMPGVIRDWHIRAIADKETPLDEKTAAALQPDDTWKRYALPETEPQTQWWMDQERKRGFAVSLTKLIGPGPKGYLGVASLEAKEPRMVYFNTGSDLRSVWLNGKRLYKNEAWTGWHAGKERIAATLRQGTNVIVIETGGQFFLSVTDTNDW
jgi:lysophospholipase L1-like esterase